MSNDDKLVECPDGCFEAVAPGYSYAGADHRAREQHRARAVRLRCKAEKDGVARLAAARVALDSAGVDVTTPAADLAAALMRDAEQVGHLAAVVADALRASGVDEHRDVLVEHARVVRRLEGERDDAVAAQRTAERVRAVGAASSELVEAELVAVRVDAAQAREELEQLTGHVDDLRRSDRLAVAESERVATELANVQAELTSETTGHDEAVAERDELALQLEVVRDSERMIRVVVTELREEQRHASLVMAVELTKAAKQAARERRRAVQDARLSVERDLAVLRAELTALREAAEPKVMPGLVIARR